MSYGNSCWNRFTVHQASRMHCWFEAVLSGWDADPPPPGTGRLIAASFGVCAPTCPWGLDDDGTVGINDFLELLANWGAC